jgi:hypothetical protein
VIQFFKRGHQIPAATGPLVQPPHQHQIDLSRARSRRRALPSASTAVPGWEPGADLLKNRAKVGLRPFRQC